MKLMTQNAVARTLGVGRCVALAATLSCAAGCTTLGPMPTVTGVAYAPEPRPNVELQAGVQPGYFLSSAVTENTKGAAIQQASGMFDPEDLIGVSGLGVGARLIGGGDESPYVEPMVRYRAYVDRDDSIALGGVLYGTKASGSSKLASYSATRFGGEYGMDFRLTPKSQWAEVHLINGLGLLRLDASGSYCEVREGYVVDCDTESGVGPNAETDVHRFFPTVFSGVNIDVARHIGGVFHGGRVGFSFAAGQMPRVRNQTQHDAVGYVSGGLALTLMLGGI